MIKRAVIAALCGVLAGCAGHAPLTKTVYRVIEPPVELYNCPEVKNLPDPSTLTDKQVADLLVDLSDANKTCKNSSLAMKDFIAKAKAKLEQ